MKSGRQPEDENKVLYLQFTNPAAYPPLEHSSRILADRGFRVRFLNPGADATAALHFQPYSGVEVRHLRYVSAGWRQKIHYARYTVWSLWHARRWRPSIIYASDVLAAPIALACMLIVRAQVVYHEHDSPSFGRSVSLFCRFCLLCRRLIARRADICILPNRERASLFQADLNTRKPPAVVWNCPRRDEVALTSPATGTSLRLIYHGSIVPARMPLRFLEGLSACPANVELTIVGYETVGARGHVRALKDEAARLGIAKNVQFIPALSRSELLVLCRACHVGLSFFPSDSTDINEKLMVGASNKPFDYMACGLAILVPRINSWVASYVDPGYALACDAWCPGDVAQTIAWCSSNRPTLARMGLAARDRIIEEWNYERMFRPVSQQLHYNR